MCRSPKTNAGKQPSSQLNGPMSTLALAQEHGWRLALIVALLAVSGRSLFLSSSSPESSTFICHLVASLFLLNWMRMEVTTIVKRRHLPPGDLGALFVGETFQAVLDPVKFALAKKERFGHTYFQSTVAGVGITFGGDRDISWLWNAERKGQAQGFWPPSIRILLGRGAVANKTGRAHRALRRLLEPAFAPNATRDYVNVIDETIRESLKMWEAADTFHSSAVFKLFALRLFFVAAFGRVPDDLIQQLHDDFSTWIQGFGSLISLRIPGTQFAKSMDARERILAVVERLIEEFRSENPPDSERGRKSMMGRICYGTDENGNPMEMEDLKDNILNMIFAGHDTTYASMGTALHYLQEYPSVREALVEEVNGFREPLDFDEMKNAPILNAFLAETWRIDPPVPGGFRKVVKPISYQGYEIPENMVLNYSNILATQNDEIYPEPSRFEIQRFLPNNHPLASDPTLHAEGVDYNQMKGSYPVFGGGTHGCLGSHFAKLEMRVLLVRMVRSYNLEVRCSEKVFFPVNGWKNEFKITAKR